MKTPSTSVRKPSNSGREDLRILSALRRIIRAVDIHSRKLATTHNLTVPQLLALMCVVEEGPVSSTHISEQIHLSGSTVVGLVDRLEAKGLVRRDRSTEDRRLVFVAATTLGIEAARAAPSPLQDRFVERLGRLDSDERDRIALSLERVVELMEARDIDASPILDVGDVKRPTASST
ncbi:MAG: MarR family transcriptional regulator [Candidatus Hydrogenedentes bacterium]|nr:MarR family transcriptional regulator [Candidatus Hydrogenedentota bacterium]